MNPVDYQGATDRGWRQCNGGRGCKPFFPSSSCYSSPPFDRRGGDFRRNSWSDHPSRFHGGNHGGSNPDFMVELICIEGGTPRPGAEVKELIARCKSRPDRYFFFESGTVAGRMFYRQWVDAREAMVSFWELRFGGAHRFDPVVASQMLQPSDMDELREALKTLFEDHVQRLLNGEAVKECRKNLVRVNDEIAQVTHSLKGKNSISKCDELWEKKKGLVSDAELISKRIQEFESGMTCIFDHLEGRQRENCRDEVPEVFKLEGALNWSRIHCLMTRELRRLEDGLPIYAYRRDILRQISSQQITVLIGETGSGKSTQVVQYLSDSGVAAGESIICTQPRKIAAITLARRVTEESNGCYDKKSIIWRPAYSSAQLSAFKVTYMTDHCLLQHYMDDNNLSGISCIVVDEAHERSLNTDLLLALVKNLLLLKPDLRLIIMSATADSNQLSDYFYGCSTFHVVGRSFPVDVKYVPPVSHVAPGSENVAPYVSDVLRMVAEIHEKEPEGTVLAFLTSQLEVEFACEKFQSPAAVSLPLHGKLSSDEQLRVFQSDPKKRKVIFATNVAETSVTIPGVRFVVDSGMVKEGRFDPSSGMSVLRVCWTSKSSANQRTGRAGRTEPGCCYRLYSEHDYELMLNHQEPEIRRVHLGIAVLRILALGVKNVGDFDFIDAPSPEAISMAVRNLIQLGAITLKNEALELTDDGWYFVKLGIEPRLGKLIRGCFDHQLKREGLVLAAVMANASSIFCRVGDIENKLNSDRLKVQFCHPSGDLFTLLSVYKEWENLPREKRNNWCWDNSINAKSMRRCQDTVIELEQCLQKEVFGIIPSYWVWNPHTVTEHDRNLKKVILSSLVENMAMYSGYERLGYVAALTGQTIQLHPSCSLLIFSEKPQWVVYGEILSYRCQYLVCVTAFDFESVSTLFPVPAFDVSKIENQRLGVRTLSGFGGTLLKKLCGKFKSNLHCLQSNIQSACEDGRITIEVNVDQNEILVFSPPKLMEKAMSFVNNALVNEQKWLRNECLEMRLFHGGSNVSPVGLFGAGAQVQHLELDNKCMTVDVFYSNTSLFDDKELLIFLEKHSSGNICSVQRLTGTGQDNEDAEKSNRITFLTPGAALKVSELNGFEFRGSVLRVSLRTFGADRKGGLGFSSFPSVKSKVYWPRRRSRGRAFITCHPSDVCLMINELSVLHNIHCEAGQRSADCVVVSGLDKDLSELEILDFLRPFTTRRILDLRLSRGDAVADLPCVACEEAILREMSPFMPKGNSIGKFCQVQVFPPEPNENFMKGMITFDGRLHLEAAQALEKIHGKVLPGCLPWQKIECQHFFRSTVWCSSSVYPVIRNQLEPLVTHSRRHKGVECSLETLDNGSYRVNISANCTKRVAELRRPFEDLMNGKLLSDPSLNPTVLQLLFSRDGFTMKKTIQKETGTFILDRHSSDIRVFGPPDRVDVALKRLSQSLLSLHESKQLEIPLRGRGLPPDLMKRVVKAFGPQLQGLKDKVPGVEPTLITRRHAISIHGDKTMRPRVEELVFKVAALTGSSEPASACRVCLCEVDDAYRLEDCGHTFCRECLVEQCESAIKSQDGFPLRCAWEGCGALILITDLKSFLPGRRLEDLFWASLRAFVVSNGGRFRFCPSPDCPSVYRPGDPGQAGGVPFRCGACYVETCTRCHQEYHPYLSCERYREFKDDPDESLKEWCRGRENVKYCPVCGHAIEKVEGCNHVECRCGRHICWNCMEHFEDSAECYDHLRTVHLTFI